MGIIEGCNWAALSSDDHIQMRPGGREEVLEELSEDFPYLAVLSQHDRYHQRTVPWHWHQEIEMFYVLDGPVVYATPHERAVLSTGAAGFVNANVLHTTFAEGGRANVNLLVHEMRPRLLAEPGGRLWRTYVAPLVSAASIELATVSPSDPRGAELCEAMRRSFDTAARTEVGWELRIRDELSEIWLAFLELLQDRLTESAATSHGARDERLRTMIDHIGHHYSERLSVAEIAASAFSSERECHRTFRDALGITPIQYLRDYRVQQACRMLAHTAMPVAAIGEACGLGSPSHFGRSFRATMGCTPSEYRLKWRDLDTSRQQDA